MGNTTNILCPRFKELFNFKCDFDSPFNKLRDTATLQLKRNLFGNLELATGFGSQN